MKLYVFDKGTILIGLLLIAFVFTVLPVRRENSAAVWRAARSLPIYSVERADKKISLTFDAAWGNEDVGDIINILNKYEIRASFFVVGDWAKKYPESVKALFDAGHEIANHSDSHSHMSRMPKEKIIADLDKCDDKVQEITGKRPNLFRAPYGEYDNNLVETVNSTGRSIIQWDVDSLDYRELTTAQMLQRIMKGVKSGSILLFHSGTKNTAAALPDIIEALIAEGYSFLPVSELIYTGDFYIDTEGRQRAK